MPVDVDNLKIFMIGGGGSGYGGHSGAGGAGYITTVNADKISKGTTIKVNIGAGGVGTLMLGANKGQATTITILGNTYTANGGLSAIHGNAPGGAGSSGGGGAGNAGPGGNGGSGGSNGANGSTYVGGAGMGTSAFQNAINFIGNSAYNFRAGLGGTTGNSTHSGGGGAGGIICDNISYPTAENGGDTTSGKGGQGFGAGGGSGGYNINTFYYGGAGAPGMAYIFV